MISLKNVNKTYPTMAGEVNALRQVTLEIESGALVVIVGRSGSGKSTLLNLIAGIDTPSRGIVSVAGTVLQELSHDSLATWRGRTVGVVFQFFQLLPTLTVAENVMLPMDFCGSVAAGKRKARSLELLHRVGVLDQADKLPSALSGGQQQRTAIARALANDPPVIIADEPTGNLDSESGATILQLFAELAAEGKTILIVSHDREVASAASRIVTINDGRVSPQCLARTA
jgi:putative ABC transport system ATP-binding protein